MIRPGRQVLLSLLTVFVVFSAGVLMARAEDKLPDLRRKLLEARGAEQNDKALYDLTQKIGEGGYFKDFGAFGDWLAGLPDGKPMDPLVRQRIGWAYIHAKRGAEAVPHLEAALENDPSDGLTRSYLGEALRQAQRFEEAAEMLGTAVRCGARGRFVYDAVVLTIVQLKKGQLSGHADDLPDYVLAAEKYLSVDPDPRIHQMVADMLLLDFKTYELPDRERGQHWAEAAARHLLAALALSTEPIANAATMAYDAAEALSVVDAETGGASLRFDLLCQAYKLGIDPADGTHGRPRVLTLLAESAAAEGRFELAYRLAQERLAISNSPRARRLLMDLPPDLGVEKED